MSTQPNIVFIMTDHTNAQALGPGSPCLTPNLDALAREGVRFSRCHTTNAICSPARASLMTGTYPSTHGMWDCTHTQRAAWVDVPADRFTYFSQLLADAGYYNAYFGKWHVEQSCKLENFGWHEYDRSCQSRRAEPEPADRVVVPREGYRDYLLAGVSSDEPANHPAFDKAIDFLQGRCSGRASGQPFCCFVSTSEPHDPYVPPRKFFEMYDLEDLPLSPTLRSEPVGKPEVIRRMRAVWKDMPESDWRMTTAAYWALITFLDSEVGRLLDTLRQTGMYDNTIIVFTSDHGDMLGGHGLVAKGVGTSYEEVYNIPLIMRVPDMPARGEDENSMVSLLDVGPTLLDLAGAAGLPQAHGRSLRPVLAGNAEPSEWRDAYAEFFGQRFVYTQRIVWHEHWKYVFSPGGIDELYDLERDPHEEHNLADDSAYRGQLVDMTRRMWRKMKEIGDDSLFNSQYATLRTAPVGPESIDQ